MTVSDFTTPYETAEVARDDSRFLAKGGELDPWMPVREAPDAVSRSDTGRAHATGENPAAQLPSNPDARESFVTQITEAGQRPAGLDCPS